MVSPSPMIDPDGIMDPENPDAPPRDAALLAALLERHPDYRVLRRFKRQATYGTAPEGVILHKALFLDVETTGLDVARDEIIEFAACYFTFDDDARIYTVGPHFQAFEQPQEPITAEITGITGITNDDVAGQIIDNDQMHDFALAAELCVAFNSDFDRKMVERRFPATFTRRKAWACAYQQVDWKLYGAVGMKLENLMPSVLGRFYDAHRALDDVHAAIGLLAEASRMRAVDGDPGAWPVTPFRELLASTREGVYRVLAHGSPFGFKDLLKRRGYKWTGEKPWFKDTANMEEAMAEARYLVDLYGVEPDVKHISARDRFSIREPH